MEGREKGGKGGKEEKRRRGRKDVHLEYTNTNHSLSFYSIDKFTSKIKIGYVHELSLAVWGWVLAQKWALAWYNTVNTFTKIISVLCIPGQWQP